jgi:hypothetical protein
MILSANQKSILYANKNLLNAVYIDGENIRSDRIDNGYTFTNICGNSDLSTVLAVRDKTKTVTYRAVTGG